MRLLLLVALAYLLWQRFRHRPEQSEFDQLFRLEEDPYLVTVWQRVAA